MFTVKLIKRSGDTYDLHVDGNPSGVLDPGHVKMVDSVVELEENTAGTFSFSLPYGNAGNTSSGFTIDPGSDEIALYQKNENGTDVEIWRGFFLESKGDFWKSGEYECLGELAYLGDSLQEAATYTYDSNTTNYPELYLTALINIHNEKMTSLGATNKLFTVGRVTVSADNTAAHIVKYVNTTKFTTSASDNTFDCIKQLISSCGGHLEVRRENGTRYLDYLKDYSSSDQSIDFGTNLIDYEHSLDLTNLVTVLYPYGESETITDATTGTTSRIARNISSVNNGRKYITLDDVFPNEGLMAKYGVREGTVVFSNVTTIENIYNLGVKYLQNIYEMLSEEIIMCKAVDMAYTNTENGETNVPPIRFLQKVKVTSRPHGLVNKYFPVTKMSIPLSAPENAVYTMAIGATGITQLSTTVTDHGKEQDKIEETIEELGGGGGGESGEGQETVPGTIDVSTWVMGTPSIGITAEEEAEGTEYIAVSKHLKLFYDASEIGKMSFVETLADFENPVSMSLVLDGGSGADTVETSTNITLTKANSCYGLWSPKFVHSALLNYDDTESRGNERATYADVSSYGFCIRTYYTGPNNTSVRRIPNTDPQKLAEGLMISKPNDVSYGYHEAAWNYIKRLLLLSDPAPTTNASYIDFNDNLYTSSGSEAQKVRPKTTIGAVIGPYVRALLPLPMRPLTNISGRGTSLVIYIVCEFVSGRMEWNNNSANGLGLYKVRGQTAPAMVSIDSSITETGVSSGSTYLCQGPGYTASGSGMPIDFYPLDMITERLSESNYEYGCHIFPKGHLYAYAFMHAVGPGKKYPLTTDITGGLAVCMNGVVYAGCSKWHKAMLEAGYQTSHVADIGYVDDPKKQFFTINQAIEFDSDGYQRMTGNTIVRAGQGCINVAAIAVCTAAPYQITMDEVAENLKSMYDKYGG